MNRKENILRTYKFQYPENVPINMNINKACWNYYDKKELENLMLKKKPHT
jgi:hypothetical protein